MISSQNPIQTTTNFIKHLRTGTSPSESPSGSGSDHFIHHSLDSVPAYVLEHAPLVYLHPNEPFWPASLQEHLKHTIIHSHRRQPVHPPSHDPFSVLAQPHLNHERSYLTATVNVRPGPRQHPWLVSIDGKPDRDHLSKASAAILILVDKSTLLGIPGTLDAFWFFFYSFNLGPTVANIRFGNHISDWEHCMIRFENGKPKAVHLSAHSDGAAYTYDSLTKTDDRKRPIIFSAFGSHAMYPKPGTHDYSPVKFIGPVDRTDYGPLWDPALHFSAFQHYPSPAKDKFRALDEAKDGKLLSCLKFRGQWGDEFSNPTTLEASQNGGWKSSLKMIDPVKRAVTLNHLRWGNGVTGPRDKDLDRIGMNRRSHKIFQTI
ncbi:hypothetical protein O181_004379 [Austropuccinia psidii MF-1]|uniref:Vacuolar protein sorting-associated protein 62 n=1 Tax=Austropuccinia psidii MF-1 TaxID=1389203 RepID=A0A9Q3GET1_9BASI|nr:hypothetical protein [Austropuccinia psidii MF-1]